MYESEFEGCANLHLRTIYTLHCLSTMHTVQRLDLRGLFPEKRDAFALIVDGVYTKEECQSLIDKTNAVGYIPRACWWTTSPENRSKE